MKSLIKMLGLSIGCSCSAIQAQQSALKELENKDAVVRSAVISDDESPDIPNALASLQDIGKIYAL